MIPGGALRPPYIIVYGAVYDRFCKSIYIPKSWRPHFNSNRTSFSLLPPPLTTTYYLNLPPLPTTTYYLHLPPRSTTCHLHLPPRSTTCHLHLPPLTIQTIDLN